MWCSGSGVVRDCIDSRSLPSYFSAYAKSSKFSSNESAIAQNNEAIVLNADVHTFSNTVGPD